MNLSQKYVRNMLDHFTNGVEKYPDQKGLPRLPIGGKFANLRFDLGSYDDLDPKCGFAETSQSP